MAKETSTALELTDVTASKAASNIIEKRYTALNGYDPALRKEAKLLILSDDMKEEKRMRGSIKFTAQYLWALDVERNKLVKVSRTGLTGGMGYEQLPQPGEWSLNEDGTWHILKPQEDDPAIATRKSWGISHIFPGAFDYDNKKIRVPKCFVIEVKSVEFLCSRNPVDANAADKIVAKELLDTTFKPDAARMWDGIAYYPTREFVNEVVERYNACHEVPFSEDLVATLLK